MLLNITCKLYPNKTQLDIIKTNCNNARFIYNHFLALTKEEYEQGFKYRGKYDYHKDITFMKNNSHEWLKESNAQVLQQMVDRLDKGMKAFFRRAKQGKGKASGYPRFKSKYDDKASITFPQSISTNDTFSKIRTPQLGMMKVRGLSSYLKNRNMTLNQIKQAIITMTNDGLITISLLCDLTPNNKNQVRETNTRLRDIGYETIGIDVGVKSLVTTSMGREITSKTILKDYNISFDKDFAKLVKHQRVLSTITKRTNKFYKQKKLITKLSRHIANKRKDMIHKVSSDLVSLNQHIVIEDLNIKQMTKNTVGTIDSPNQDSKRKSNLNKVILQGSWGLLFQHLEYKLNIRGGTLTKVDPKYTSQTCSCCGNISKQSRQGKKYHCVSCDIHLDADVNASLNILERGVSSKEAYRSFFWTYTFNIKPHNTNSVNTMFHNKVKHLKSA